MTQVHICHLGCSVCVAASVMPPWHKIKVIVRFLPWMLDLSLGRVECSNWTSFASRLFNTLCFIID